MVTWKQAELLMQPAFIRLIDNIRKQLDLSSWKGTYREFPIWPDGTSEETKATVTELQKQLTQTSGEEAREIEQVLEHLPKSYPGYQLLLQKAEQEVTVDLWDLCYQICFVGIELSQGDQPVQIDTSLIDDIGEVDWNRLEAKTKRLVEQVFASLPG